MNITATLVDILSPQRELKIRFTKRGIDLMVELDKSILGDDERKLNQTNCEGEGIDPVNPIAYLLVKNLGDQAVQVHIRHSRLVVISAAEDMSLNTIKGVVLTTLRQHGYNKTVGDKLTDALAGLLQQFMPTRSEPQPESTGSVTVYFKWTAFWDR